MREENYKPAFDEFIRKIIELKNPSFINTNKWRLCNDVLNGIEIGYTIDELYDRILLHNTAQKYGLIALCPGEVIDLKYEDDSETIKHAVVRTKFGNLKIESKKS